MTRIFVSHASQERRFAERVVGGLERLGLPCWMAPRDIVPGMDYQSSLYAAIKQCDALLVLVCAGSNKSEDVARELALARKEKKPIVPARIRNVEPEAAVAYQITAAQWVDLFSDFDENLARLSRELAKRLQLSEQVAAAAAKLQRRQRVVWWSAGFAAVFAAAVAGMLIPRFMSLVVGASRPGGLAAAPSLAPPAWSVPPPTALPRVAAPAAPSSDAASSITASIALPSVAAAAPTATDPLDRFVRDYYARLSDAPMAAVGYLGEVVSEPVHFYGKTIDKRKLIDEQQAYFRRWPDRRFVVRPGSVATSCDAAGTSCSVAGVLDYDVRDPASDQAHWGTERFELQLLRLGSGLQLTGINGSAVERHSGSASRHAALIPAP